MSGRKNVLLPVLVVTAGDMSQATVTSKATNIQYLDNVSYHMVWTGSPVGIVDLQGSHDGATFTSIPLGTPIAPSGADGNALLDLNQLSFPWVRVVYTKTSGTGALSVTITGKEI